MADQPTDEKPKFDPFKPDDPRLPGVPEKKKTGAAPVGEPAEAQPVTPAWMQKLPPQLRSLPPAALYGGGGAIALFVIVILWMVFGSGSAPPPEPSVTPTTASSTPAAAPPAAASGPAEPLPDLVRLPATVATTQEMAKPWSYKRFIIQQASGRVPAMVVRIPVASAGSSSGYWAFLTRTPFGRCDLELITDLQKLAGEYNFRSNTPMVVEPCTQTIFHPLQMGSIGPNTYTRGEVVRGTALRPPVAIDIRVQRGEVVAVRTE